MCHDGRQPEGYRATEAGQAFARRAFKLWTFISLLCVAVGNVIGWFVARCSSNVLGTAVLSIGVFAWSLLMCRGLTRALWEDPKSKPIVLGFAIAMGTAGFVAVGGLVVMGSQAMQTLASEMCGVSFSGGFLYLGGVVWGLVVGIWRRRAFEQLGKQ